MADGDILNPGALFLLIDDAQANNNGVWVSTGQAGECFINILDADGNPTFGASVNIHGSNELAQPLATTNASTLTVAPITAPDYIIHAILPSWIKARVTDYTSGKIRVIMRLSK